MRLALEAGCMSVRLCPLGFESLRFHFSGKVGAINPTPYQKKKKSTMYLYQKLVHESKSWLEVNEYKYLYYYGSFIPMLTLSLPPTSIFVHLDMCLLNESCKVSFFCKWIVSPSDHCDWCGKGLSMHFIYLMRNEPLLIKERVQYCSKVDKRSKMNKNQRKQVCIFNLTYCFLLFSIFMFVEV